jgi:biofilm PGA synthesis N-glycosyltransferase PgaC
MEPAWKSHGTPPEQDSGRPEVDRHCGREASVLLDSGDYMVHAHLIQRTDEPGRREREPSPGFAPQCSVGIMAYNEEANIADAIASILEQQTRWGVIAEIIVVASGCEDRTAEIVAGLAQRDRRIRLIEQQRREGKASAINLFIAAARSEVLLMVSADVLVKRGTLDALLRNFDDPTVGMVGGHPTPVNDEATFLGHAVHLQWRLHDRIARQSPKLGEIVAFRNVVPSVPLDTAVDEISIQAIVTQLGYRLVYEPRAVVYNRGPATVRDFLRQRRRIYAGHLRIREQQAYSASTMSTRRVVGAMWGSGSFATPRAALWSVGTVGLEATARTLGHYDVMCRRPQHVWEVSGTTKSDIADGANGESLQNVAVFHIIDFHHRQLEVGVHTSRQLTRRVADEIKRALGSKAIVSIRQSGTIVALLPGDREEAERAAHELVDRLKAAPLSRNGHGTTAPVELACAIIAFPRVGPPLARPIPLPAFEAEPAASIAG